MHDESVWAERALRAGAKGYIMKDEASDSVITALRTIRDGSIHVSEAMMTQLLSSFQENPQCRGAGTVDLLTDRELQVFRLIGAALPPVRLPSSLISASKPSAPIVTGYGRNSISRAALN